MAEQEYLRGRPIISAESTTATFALIGSVLLAGLFVSGQYSTSLVAAICLFATGIALFMLALMFLVTVKMKVNRGSVAFGEEERQWKIALPFMFGTIAYIAALIFTCLHAINIPFV